MGCIALIPARSGSKRIINKNIKLLGEHPMLSYTITAAIKSGVFDAVVCATDSEIYADIARHYGAEVPFLRPLEISGSKSPDIAWVSWLLNKLKAQNRNYETFSILRPTSPFRQPETIRRAWNLFINETGIDSLRAIEPCNQHPGKMWVVRNKRMFPLLPFATDDATPWHSSQYAALPEFYSQNASLEIAWSRVVLEYESISGEAIAPFISQGLEGFDINNLEDWLLAEYYLSMGVAQLPSITKRPYLINNGVYNG